jgi:superfamily I DNA/RNA helicase
MDTERVAGWGGGEDIGLSDIAVLVRLRALMDPIAKALRRLGLPVQVVGHQAYLDHAGAREAIAALRSFKPQGSGHSAADAVARCADRLESARPATRDALEECRVLAESFRGTLTDFLDFLALRQGADSYNERAEQVTLMTLHAAKGLEFPVVFIAGCEDGILPYTRPGEEPDEEEERRLLYVGMTRAKHALYLTSARKRMLHGRAGQEKASPFLIEIAETLRRDADTGRPRAKPRNGQTEFAFPS